MNENGIIVEKEKEVITIEIIKEDIAKCAGCTLKSVCGNPNQKLRRIKVRAKNSNDLTVGDKISFEVPESRGILYSTLVFFVPLVVFLVPILAINNLPDLIKILFGLAGMALYFLLLKFVSIKLIPSIHLIKV